MELNSYNPFKLPIDAGSQSSHLSDSSVYSGSFVGANLPIKEKVDQKSKDQIDQKSRLRISTEDSSMLTSEESSRTDPGTKLQNPSKILEEYKIPPRKIVTQSEPILNSIGSSLKIGVGVVLGAVGGGGALAVLPLTATGRYIGITLGKEKSKAESKIAPDKQTVFIGTAIGSLGFSAVASYGKKMINDGTNEIRVNVKEYKHIEDSSLYYAYQGYKKEVNDLKDKIDVKTKEASNIDSKTNSSLHLAKLAEVDALREQLNALKQLHPLKLNIIDRIYRDFAPSHLNINQRIELKNLIIETVFSAKSDNPIRLSSSRNQLVYVISKGSLGDPKVFEVAKKADLIAEGSYGVIHNVKYLHEQKKSAKFEPQIMKLAKDTHAAKSDVKYEGKVLNRYGGQRGIQDKTTTRFEEGYVAKKMSGSAKDLIQLELDKKIHITVKEKTRMTKDVLAGKKLFEQNEIVHMDIKPGNMLFDAETKKLVLSDFGGVSHINDLLDVKSLPANVNNLLGVRTARYVSKTIVNKLQDELNKANAEIQQLQNDAWYDQRKLEVIKKFNDKAKPLLFANVDFEIGLSLYHLWAKSDHSFLEFSKPDRFAKVAPHDYHTFEYELDKIKEMPREIKETILALLEPGVTGPLRDSGGNFI